jgi:hypothetical protein
MRAFIDQLSFRTRVVVVICIVLTTYVILVFDFDAEHHLSAPARPGGVASAQSYSDRPFLSVQSRLPTATFLVQPPWLTSMAPLNRTRMLPCWSG